MSSDWNQLAGRRANVLVIASPLFLAVGMAAAPGLFPSSAHAGQVVQEPSAEKYSDPELKALETEKEQEIRALRDQEITQLRLALGRRIPSNRAADLQVRLAELYLEAYRLEFLLEGRAHEERIKKGSRASRIDHAHSFQWLRKAIQASGEVLHFGLSYPAIDRIYFFLGYAYSELGDEKASERNYELLVKARPGSPLVAEAHRELGDFAFSRRDYARARDHFSVSAKLSKDDSLTARVLHKLAWSHYRLRNPDQAVASMRQSIASAAKSGEKMLSLREEALRDLAVFMTEFGKVDEAIQYFKEVAGDQQFYPKALERLGRQYERNVEPEKATQVYESLLKTNPADEASFRVLVKLVDLDLRRSRFSNAAARIRKGKISKSFLAGSGEPETQTASRNLRAMVRRTATEQHELYRRKAVRGALETAEDFYQLYRDFFLAVDDARKEDPEIRMYQADVKRELGKAKEASKIYREVIDSGDKRYAKEAGALWTASLADAIRKAPAAAAAVEPSGLEKEFVEAADEMQESLGELPEGREAALKAAQLLAGYSTTQKDALKRARKLTEKAPQSPQALTAAKLWIQTLAERLPKQAGAIEKSDAASVLREAMEDLRKNQALFANDSAKGQGSLTALLAAMDSRLKVGEIALQEQSQNFTAAAAGYEELAARPGKPEIVEGAFGNALSAHAKAQRFDNVVRVALAWSKRVPQSKRPREALRTAATVAFVQGHFEGAALLFATLGREYQDEDSLLTAAQFREGLGQSQQARELWSDHLKRFSRSSGRAAISLRLAQSLEFEKKDTEAAKFLRFCVQVGGQDTGVECAARLGDLYSRAADTDNAKQFYEKAAGGRSKSSGLISPYAAYGAFRLAELLEREGQFSPFVNEAEPLRKAINERATFLERLNRAYLRAVEAGGPWGVAALDRLAGWVWSFTEELEKIPAPATDSEAFRKSLKESVIEPFRAKARETWESAYRKAIAQEVLSPALPVIGDRLADAGSKSPRRAQGFRSRLRLAGMPVDGGPEGRAGAMEKVRAFLSVAVPPASAWVDYGNLLWGEGKPLLARVCYERALTVDPKNAAARNNRAVVLLDRTGFEDASVVQEAMVDLREALKAEDLFIPAKFNRAVLLNYYRHFSTAARLWEQVNVKLPNASEVLDGWASALQGMGEPGKAQNLFSKSRELGAPKNRPVATYHETAVSFASGKDGKACLARLGEIEDAILVGFERDAVERLRKTCSEGQGK